MAKAQSQTQALARWDAELARQAEAAAKQEANTGGGQFFSLRGGTLKLNDAPLPNSEMAVVVVDAVLENVFYSQEFDPESPTSPDCYAFGRDEATLAPHEAVEQKQSELCADCPQNRWGSSDKGRGKACRNRRRLACVAAGTLDARTGAFEAYDAEALKAGQLAYLALPPTSLNSWGAYVKQLAATVRRPPHAVVTRVKVVPDPKTQLKVTFELIDVLDQELIPVAMELHEAQASQIAFPYAKLEAASPKRGAKKGSRKY
jgi:hypothetical protein